MPIKDPVSYRALCFFCCMYDMLFILFIARLQAEEYFCFSLTYMMDVESEKNRVLDRYKERGNEKPWTS